MSKVPLIFLATLALGVRFNIPRTALWVSATIASLSFVVVEFLRQAGAYDPESAFVGAFLVAMSSEILARVLKVPSPVLSIPAVIPMVPGSVAYRAVIQLVRGEGVAAMSIGTRVVLTSVAIASGILLAGAIARKGLRPVFSGKTSPA